MYRLDVHVLRSATVPYCTASADHDPERNDRHCDARGEVEDARNSRWFRVSCPKHTNAGEGCIRHPTPPPHVLVQSQHARGLPVSEIY
jgi:hypothetical protein